MIINRILISYFNSLLSINFGHFKLKFYYSNQSIKYYYYMNRQYLIIKIFDYER